MKELLFKLGVIQNTLKAPKNQHNDFGKYNYRSCEDILEAVKPLLKEQELVLKLEDELVYIGERYYVKATAFLYGDGGCLTNVAYAREEESKKGMDGSQITGASSSYARKYALNGLFLIDDTKDSDFTNTGELTEEQARQYTFGGKKHPGQTILEVYESGDDKFLNWCLNSDKVAEDTKKAIEMLTPLRRIPIPTDEEQEQRLYLLNKIITTKNVDDIKKDFMVNDLTELTTEQMEAIVNE
jgi:hypothetical protein